MPGTGLGAVGLRKKMRKKNRNCSIRDLNALQGLDQPCQSGVSPEVVSVSVASCSWAGDNREKMMSRSLKYLLTSTAVILSPFNPAPHGPYPASC